MSKKKDCFGKFPVNGSYSPTLEISSERIRSKSSLTYTCRSQDCPYMKDCVVASMYADPVEAYKERERDRKKASTRAVSKDLSVTVSR